MPMLTKVPLEYSGDRLPYLVGPILGRAHVSEHIEPVVSVKL